MKDEDSDERATRYWYHASNSNPTPRDKILDAIESNNYSELKALLKYKTELNTYLNYSQKTYLGAAVARNLPNIVELLIQNGANIDLPHNNESVLIKAASYNYSEIVSILLKYKADINGNNNFNKETALIAAITANSYDAAKTLVAAGANINIQDKSGKTALDYAAQSHDKRLLLLLAPKSTEVNIENLVSAIQNNNLAQIDQMIKSGINTKIDSKLLNDAVIYSISKGYNKAVEAALPFLKIDSLDPAHRETILDYLLDNDGDADLINSLLPASEFEKYREAEARKYEEDMVAHALKKFKEYLTNAINQSEEDKVNLVKEAKKLVEDREAKFEEARKAEEAEKAEKARAAEEVNKQLLPKFIQAINTEDLDAVQLLMQPNFITHITPDARKKIFSKAAAQKHYTIFEEFFNFIDIKELDYDSLKYVLQCALTKENEFGHIIKPTSSILKEIEDFKKLEVTKKAEEARKIEVIKMPAAIISMNEAEKSIMLLKNDTARKLAEFKMRKEAEEAKKAEETKKPAAVSINEAEDFMKRVQSDSARKLEEFRKRKEAEEFTKIEEARRKEAEESKSRNR